MGNSYTKPGNGEKDSQKLMEKCGKFEFTFYLKNQRISFKLFTNMKLIRVKRLKSKVLCVRNLEKNLKKREIYTQLDFYAKNMTFHN